MEALSFNTPIGHLLMKQGVLSLEQCNRVLQEQEDSGRPFGALAEELFGVSSAAVEKAWADQYASMAQWIDPELSRPDPAALSTVSVEQARSHNILPMSMKGDQLTICTTHEGLVGAVDFVNAHFGRVCYFVLTTPNNMARALQRHYPPQGHKAQQPSIARDAA